MCFEAFVQFNASLEEVCHSLHLPLASYRISNGVFRYHKHFTGLSRVGWQASVLCTLPCCACCKDQERKCVMHCCMPSRPPFHIWLTTRLTVVKGCLSQAETDKALLTQDTSEFAGLLHKQVLDSISQCRQCLRFGIWRKCANCRVARYCSLVCQLQHWEEHSADCRAPVKPQATGKGYIVARQSWPRLGLQSDEVQGSPKLGMLPTVEELLAAVKDMPLPVSDSATS